MSIIEFKLLESYQLASELIHLAGTIETDEQRVEWIKKASKLLKQENEADEQTIN